MSEKFSSWTANPKLVASADNNNKSIPQQTNHFSVRMK